MIETANAVALHIFQEALMLLADWANTTIAQSPVSVDSPADRAISQAKHLTDFPADSRSIGTLRAVFDTVTLTHGQPEAHYWPALAISNAEDSDRPSGKQYPRIPYPSTTPPSTDELNVLKQEIATALGSLEAEQWNQLPYLSLVLEKFGTYLSFGDEDISLFDRVKTTAGVASCLASNPDAEELCLIAGDLSGIQDFIYTISSDGALKSLRARSFTLELVTEEILQQLLTRLGLPRSNAIYAGGGNLYLLAPAQDSTHQTVETIRNEFNEWLFEEFQGKVFLGLTSLNFPKAEVGSAQFAHRWEGAIGQLGIQKSRKFARQLSQLLEVKDSHEPCKVCHRDDVEQLKPLGGDGVDACPTCNTMFDLGQRLFRVGSMVRSEIRTENCLDSVEIKIGSQTIYYNLFEADKAIQKSPLSTYIINNWDLSLYNSAQLKNPTPLLLGNYGQRANEDPYSFMTAEEMANTAAGISRVGHLRMDVDRLGRIFAKGLGEHYTLPRLAGLSRQMSYFFKVYLNSLAQYRQRDLLAHSEQSFQSLTAQPRTNLLFIYAGGDDLFVSGSWDQLTEFAFDVYQSFRAFTGNHPDITLSAGISLKGPKYPLYRAAGKYGAGGAELAAKANNRDSLCLFDLVYKWDEWLGNRNQKASELSSIPEQTRRYIDDDSTLALFGIFPFVRKLKDTLGINYSKGFVRNLLSTAQLQERQLAITHKKKLSGERNADLRAVRYFLHLPRVAYTLARLPSVVRKREEFEDISTSLKSPYNAPYFRAIATWLELLTRTTGDSNSNGK
ncbi:MAG: type III-A CRISPR-associated protein Cas10/Csm1 [Cyanobacteria bacterium P01_G01_bin.4]